MNGHFMRCLSVVSADFASGMMVELAFERPISLGFTIFACIVVAAALAGILFTKNGELAGLGRVTKRGGFRAPHGRLIRTKRLDQTEETSFGSRFVILFAFVLVATVVLCGLHLIGLLSSGVFVTIHFAVCVALCFGVAHSDSGVWRPFAYALFGYLLFAAVPSLLWALSLFGLSSLDVESVNLVTAVFGALGCALSVAYLPAVFSYAREFEDGYVNAIQVSSRSVARKAYDALIDNSWRPPADRIEHFRAAEDIRSFMEKR